MQNVSGKLTDIRIKREKASTSLRKLTDGKGLQLWIMPQGGRYWRFDYRFNGKRKLLALGIYPEVSLAMARRKADAARELVARDIDPSNDRKERARTEAGKAQNTFTTVARRLLLKKKREGRALATLEKFDWILRKVEDNLGWRPITETTTPHVIEVLQEEEDRGNLETARRMRTVIGEVFRYSIQTGLCTYDPVGATRGAIARPTVKHHAAILDPGGLKDLLQKIHLYALQNVTVGTALKLMALLYPRPGELRQANWSEIDLREAIWTIPGDRMKMRQPHVVPLPRQAAELLEMIAPITGPEGYVFPATGRAGRCMSENTMNAALKRMGIQGSEHSVHGFRATASTLLNASGLFSIDAIERSLAHQDRDAVRRAYARGDALSERRRMAQWWADHLDELRQ